MYFDAVLKDDNMHEVLFNGTPGEVKKWLKENPKENDERLVGIGAEFQIVSVSEYLSR